MLFRIICTFYFNDFGPEKIFYYSNLSSKNNNLKSESNSNFQHPQIKDEILKKVKNRIEL